MSISREESDRIARELWGPTMRDEPMNEEMRALVERQMAHIRELERQGRRRPPTEDQLAISQAWADSEMRRIEQKRANTQE